MMGLSGCQRFIGRGVEGLIMQLVDLIAKVGKTYGGDSNEILSNANEITGWLLILSSILEVSVEDIEDVSLPTDDGNLVVSLVNGVTTVVSVGDVQAASLRHIAQLGAKLAESEKLEKRVAALEHKLQILWNSTQGYGI